jgi:FtsZ-interacting cell division protein ZipA
MNEYPSYQARPISTLGFIIGAVLLIVLLMSGVYFGKKYILASQSPRDDVKIAQEVKKQTDNAKETTKKAAEQARNKEVEKKAAEDRKKAEVEAARIAAEKKKQDEAAAALAQQQAQTAAANVANPTHVASTGPEDVPLAVLGILALSYAGYRFYESRRDIANLLSR